MPKKKQKKRDVLQHLCLREVCGALLECMDITSIVLFPTKFNWEPSTAHFPKKQMIKRVSIFLPCRSFFCLFFLGMLPYPHLQAIIQVSLYWPPFKIVSTLPKRQFTIASNCKSNNKQPICSLKETSVQRVKETPIYNSLICKKPSLAT